MKYMNFAESLEHIRAAFIVHPNEFVKRNIETNMLSFLPTALHKHILVLTLTETDSNATVISTLKQLPKYCTVSVSDKALFKEMSGRKSVPKVVGELIPWGDKLVQYCNYSSQSLYLHANLIHNRKCFEHITYFKQHGKVLSTQLPRILRMPTTDSEVDKAFTYLLKQPVLGVDIEATSLLFYEAQLVSISFAVDEQRGFSFHVKLCDFIPAMVAFFKAYKGRLVWHNGSYDVKVLSYLYFDSDSRELYRTFEDTMFLHYICTNSPERFPRDLGTLISDLCGEYKLSAAEYKDMMNVDPVKCCEYNLDDSRGTLWLYSKYRGAIHSEELYSKFKEWQWYLTQVELAGMPFCYERMEEVDKLLASRLAKAKADLLKRPEVEQAMQRIRSIKVAKDNLKRQLQREEWEYPLEFNPNSGKQLAVLLFDVMGLPVLSKTKSGAPSVDGDTLAALRNRVPESQQVIFDNLVEISDTSKMKGTFINALKVHSKKVNGWYRLFGSYNLAKVVSGRLSSSDPNLQNLPSGSSLAKLFKSIFIAPPGWLWGGADYSSLEERVNTILTGDPNKRAVYLHGYDGHSFRAFSYFADELQDIHAEAALCKTEEERVKVINSIEHRYKKLRSKGKSPTFLLQYLGTAYGLVRTCGFTEAEATRLYNQYYELYKVSAKWLDGKLEEVADRGYAEVAYGLRVYCYGITRVLLNAKRTPPAIQKYIRTLGNAIGGQSYGQLNVDAGCRFLKRVYAAGLQDRVKVVGTIHDATYPTWENDPELTAWVNKNLTECMADISELPELAGDIPLPANLDIYMPSWDKPLTLQNDWGTEEIVKAMEGYLNDPENAG